MVPSGVEAAVRGINYGAASDATGQRSVVPVLSRLAPVPTTPQTTPTGTPSGSTTTAPDWLPSDLHRLLDAIPPWVLDAVQALLVVVLAYLVAQLLVRLFGRRIARRFQRPSLTQMALRGIKGGVYLFGFLTVLSIYGIELSDITLSVAILSAVVGVILAPIVGSVVSGMFLLADQPYEIGDMIELAERNQRGFVEDITLRYTKMFTLDNTFLVIPNGTIRERDVVNYSAEDSRTRQTLDVLVTYESDVALARQLIEDAARRVEGVIEGGPQIRIGAARYPAAPTCYIAEYGDHGVLLRLRYWIETPYWLLRMRSRIQTNLWTEIEDEDVEIAYPHQHQVFDETSGTMEVSLVDGQADSGRTPESGADRPGRENASDEPEDGQIGTSPSESRDDTAE